MSVESAVLENWATYKPLTDHVPKGRVWAGNVPQNDTEQEPIERPYVKLTVENPETVRSSHSYFITATLTMEIYCDSEAEANSILELATGFFDGKERTYSRGRILDMKRQGELTAADDDDQWRLDVPWRIQVAETR